MDFISGVRASDYAIAAPHAKASATNGLGNLMVSLSANALFYFFVWMRGWIDFGLHG